MSLPTPGDLPDPGIKPESPASPELAGGSFTTSATWKTYDKPSENEGEVAQACPAF